MSKLKKYTYTAIVLLLLVGIIAFSFYNNHEVVIYLIFTEKVIVPLYRVILLSFVAGILVAFLLLLPKIFANKIKLKRQIKKNNELVKEKTQN